MVKVKIITIEKKEYIKDIEEFNNMTQEELMILTNQKPIINLEFYDE